jgi:Ca2+-binding RTX toxin-like protein
MGTVTFYDGATKLGESSLVNEVAAWTGKIKGAGVHQLHAVYVADDFFGGGVSGDTYVTTFEAKVLPGGALRVTGTPGDDTILVTNTGNTQVIASNEILSFATPTSIYVDAGAGNDIALIGDDLPAGTIQGGGGDDWLVSGNGNDMLAGKGGNDKIEAGSGNDTALGGKGNDTIYGGLGDDLIGGAGGDDLIYGQTGNDTISGDGGQDTLKGAGGDDVIAAFDLNADVLTGGTGTDTAYFDSQLDSRQDVFEVLHPDEPYVLA